MKKNNKLSPILKFPIKNLTFWTTRTFSIFDKKFNIWTTGILRLSGTKIYTGYFETSDTDTKGFIQNFEIPSKNTWILEKKTYF